MSAHARDFQKQDGGHNILKIPLSVNDKIRIEKQMIILDIAAHYEYSLQIRRMLKALISQINVENTGKFDSFCTFSQKIKH